MEIDDTLFWIGHASFYIKARNSTIFIDPFRVGSAVKEKADLVLVTHAHFDHNSKEDIDKVSKGNTKYIGAAKCLEGYKMAAVSKPGFRTLFNGIKIEAVPAYNNREERLQFHPKAENWVGYIIEIDGTRIYHAGDTDSIPEMAGLKDIDIALLPMGGKYTMTMEEALGAEKAINAKSIVPMHYKMLLGEEGSRRLEKELKAKLDNVHIMREVQAPIYSF
ncbi:MAG: MBL fold metallo-hydrolase [Candidatus Micrarchaeaceae archaeon]|jgi:L-ascorbate metabolism protein UlaG (beta-lactamase superfamily)